MSERSTSRNIRLLEVQEIIFNAVFVLPILLPYYRDDIGLNFQDLLLGKAIASAVIMGLEVPSGWLSDIWKRKYVLILSFVVWGISCFVLVIADTLLWSLVAQALLGVAVSLKSGTDSAILYDTLLARKRELEFTRLEGRKKGYGLYMLAGSSIAGGFLYEIHRDLPLWGTIVFAFFGIILTLFLHEPPRHKSAIQSHPVADMLITMRYAVRHKDIGLILTFSAVLFASTELIMRSQQLYYIELGIPEGFFGILGAAGFLLAGVASHTSHLFKNLFSNMGAILIGLVTAAVICFVSSYLMNYWGVALLMFGGTFIFGAVQPRVTDAINRRVESDRRTTVLSTVSLARELLFIPFSLVAGWISAQYGITGVLNNFALWLFLVGACLFFWRKRSS